MEQNQPLTIGKEDFERISELLSRARMEIVELLDEELARATVVPMESLPADVVAMNSKVTFVDLDSKKEQSITLVYPQDADIAKERVSILAPVGAALIGLRVGQSIDWPVSEGKVKRIQVVDVKHEELIA